MEEIHWPDFNSESPDKNLTKKKKGGGVNVSATLYVNAGPPGSGKSTAAKDWRSLEVVSTDQIRADRFGGRHDVWGDERKFAAWRRWGFEEALRRSASFLQAGTDVLLDITACLPRERETVLNSLGQYAERKIVHVFRTPFDVCLSRNAAREFPVPEEVVRDKFRSLWLEPPALTEGFDQVFCAPVCIRWRAKNGSAEVVFSAEQMSIQLSSLPSWTKAEGEGEARRLQHELLRAFPGSETDDPHLFSDLKKDAAFAITWQVSHPRFAELRPLTEEWSALQVLFPPE